MISFEGSGIVLLVLLTHLPEHTEESNEKSMSG
jgi:hypothetical protein